jgi:hypothetical protein
MRSIRDEMTIQESHVKELTEQLDQAKEVRWVSKGQPGDGRDRASTRKHSQNNPRGMVNSARKSKKKNFLIKF